MHERQFSGDVALMARSCEERGCFVVPRAGLEPAHLTAAHFKCDVSTNFTIGARCEAGD